MYCRGLLSRRLISGRSLPPKQHRKPRPWRLLLRGAMVTAGSGDSQQAGALGPHRDLSRGAESTEWSDMAARARGQWSLYHHNFFVQLSGALNPTAKHFSSFSTGRHFLLTTPSPCFLTHTFRFLLCASREEDGYSVVPSWTLRRSVMALILPTPSCQMEDIP